MLHLNLMWKKHLCFVQPVASEEIVSRSDDATATVVLLVILIVTH